MLKDVRGRSSRGTVAKKARKRRARQARGADVCGAIRGKEGFEVGGRG